MGGVEQLLLRDLMRDEDAMVASGVTTETGDLSSVNVAVQLSNSSDYMGYRLTTQIGLRYGRTQTELVLERTTAALPRAARAAIRRLALSPCTLEFSNGHAAS